MVLTRFSAVLERHKAEINPTQYWRYKGGRLPKLLTWLAERPELAEALAEDARAMRAERPIVGQREAA
jgi:hypothetical protein